MYEDLRATYNEQLRERTQMANSSHYKRASATKHTKPATRQDALTRKEWEKLNGDVKTDYAPLTLVGYKKMTAVRKQAWLAYLRQTFYADPFMISKMLTGDSSAADQVRTDIKNLRKRGISIGGRKDTSPTAEQISAWNAWLKKYKWPHGYYYTGEEKRAKEEPKEEIQPVDVVVPTVIEEPTPEIHELEPAAETVNAAVEVVAVESVVETVVEEPMTETTEPKKPAPVIEDLRPISWERLLMRYTDADLVAYVSLLKETYNVSNENLSSMFDVSLARYNEWCEYLRGEGHTIPNAKRGGSIETYRDNATRWNAWLAEYNWPTGYIKLKTNENDESKNSNENAKEDNDMNKSQSAIAAAHPAGRLVMNPSGASAGTTTTPPTRTVTMTGNGSIHSTITTPPTNTPPTETKAEEQKAVTTPVAEPAKGLVDQVTLMKDIAANNAIILQALGNMTAVLGELKDLIKAMPKPAEAAPAVQAAPAPSFSYIQEPGENPEALISWIESGVTFMGSERLLVTITVNRD